MKTHNEDTIVSSKARVQSTKPENSSPVAATELAGRVVAARVAKVIKDADGARVVYAIVDLGKELTSAIGRTVAKIPLTTGKVEVAIHSELAVHGLEQEFLSDEVATRFRNRKTNGVVATIFSVPGRQMEEVLQSLGSVERINMPWLCDPKKANIWASEMLPGYDSKIPYQLTAILRGLMDSDILVSAQMCAEFCAEVSEGIIGSEGLPLMKAINNALPCLRLPRDCIDTRADNFSRNATVQFRQLRDEFQPHLYLISKKGETHPQQEMLEHIARLKDEKTLQPKTAEALTELINDRAVTKGDWLPSQQKVANLPWPEVRPFFGKRTSRHSNTLGNDTIKVLDDQFPSTLSEDEKELLQDLRRETGKANPEYEALFVRHREHLRTDPRLYKKWERFIFDKPVEVDDDLLLGLIQLAERAFQDADDMEEPVLLVRLRGAEKMSFWTKEKNTNLCAYLRDRYKGLDQVLKPHVELRFGRCWEYDWETEIPYNDRNRKGSKNAEFEFEAYVVPRTDLASTESNERLLSESNKAQMTWKPGHSTFASALAEDLRRLLPPNQSNAFLLRSRVSAARSARGSVTERTTITSITSITDSLDESGGALANPDKEWSRIDQFWLPKLARHSCQVLSDEQRVELRQAFLTFQEDYTSAIRAMTNNEGMGLASPALVTQAKSYGTLLNKLRKTARTDTLVREVWEPLLELGTATVRGESDVRIVTPWQPLRLLELAVKAHQAAQVIGRIITSSATEATGVEDYVKDRFRALQDTYYANVGLLRTEAEVQILVETEARAGYSLLESPFSQAHTGLTNEPVKHAAERFGEIAERYLNQRPHDRANFSTVLLDTESEELPVLVADYLTNQIENEAEMRCDLTITHEDPEKLSKIYEQQNSRISYEVDSSLTNEAGRIFLSRLRTGIVPPQSLGSNMGTKRQDILLLHDVIARHAKPTWHEVSFSHAGDEPLDHIPTVVSRRRSQPQGQLSMSVYLTSPSQIEASQAYLDALHDVFDGRFSDIKKHFIPAQEVELRSSYITNKLASAHQMANWVMTYDRVADRRLIAASNDRLRILRYFSAPRSLHNVIVSTEFSEEDLRDRLRVDIENILPDHNSDILNSLIAEIRRRSTNLSGGIVMRGAHWDNYARELIGIIVAQREIELLLAKQGENRTAMFFLDEFKDWLDLSGEISDILAVDLCLSPSDQPMIRLVVSEAKCVGEEAASQSRNKSWAQLEHTYTAIVNRFVKNETAVDPAIWRNRLADMLIEHMDPWAQRETPGGMTFDKWINALREGHLPIEVSAHSILSVHDKPNSAPDLDLRTADLERTRAERRRLAQWTLGADRIAKSIHGIAYGVEDKQIHEPGDWPSTPAVSMSEQHISWSKPKDGVSTIDESVRQVGKVNDKPPFGNTECANAATAIVDDEQESTPSETLPQEDGKAECYPEQSSGGNVTTSESVDNVPQSNTTVEATTDRLSCVSHPDELTLPHGWKREVHAALVAMRREEDEHKGLDWLETQVRRFKQALQAENMAAPVEGTQLTPNAGLVHVGGQVVTVGWLERRQIDLMTRYGIEIVRITPQPGRIAVALRRPQRAILHLADAWLRRDLEASAPEKNMALVIGEQEDDGELFYLSLEDDFAGLERAAPHTLVSGTTGSGKGILVSNLILDVCAFNDPRSVEIILIDPKRGADYLWAGDLPHLRCGIVDEKEAAVALLRRLVQEMDQRYLKITQAGFANIDQYNRRQDQASKLPRVVIFFDEVANWMQDDEFKSDVESLINEIATKSRAAGLHLFMIYQRADNQVMTMQLRTNLGNKLILRLGDEGSSRIALGEKGAERLLGKGHVIAKLGSDQKIYGQVPFIDEDEIRDLVKAIAQAWGQRSA